MLAFLSKWIQISAVLVVLLLTGATLHAQTGRTPLTPENIQTVALVEVQPWAGRLRAFRFSLDGRWLAGTGVIAGNAHDPLGIWDTATWELTTTQPIDWHGALAFSPDSRLVAFAQGEQIVVWELERRAAVVTIARVSEPDGFLDNYPTAVIFTPDGANLIIGYRDGQLEIWNITAAAPRLVAAFRPHRVQIENFALSPDGTLLAVAYFQNAVALWDLRGGIEIVSPGDLLPYGQFVGAERLEFSRDGALLGVFGGSRSAVLWDVPARRLLDPQPELAYFAESALLSPDARTLLLTTDYFGELGFLDLPSGDVVNWSVDDRYSPLAMNADWSLGVLGGRQYVTALDPAGGRLHSLLNIGAQAVAITPDGSAIIASPGNQLWVFALPTAAQPALTIYPAHLRQAAFVRTEPDVASHEDLVPKGEVSVIGRDAAGEFVYVLDYGGWVLNDPAFIDLNGVSVDVLPVFPIR
ncbi:MAG: WD40 repeat domain-containing protein [Anaerolineae bacterium]|nr:WD40 repeat domain-containing protein [Anaerolineae bacterium]